MLSIKMLGEASFAVDGEPIKPLRSRTATALLVYLASHSRSFSRSFLAEFFWDDRTPSQASANLRTALKLLRPVFGDYLLIERLSVGFNHDSKFDMDAALFADQLESLLPSLEPPLRESQVEELAAVLDLYRGNFLESFHLSNSAGFEAWQRDEQTRHQQLAEQGLRRLVTYYLATGDYQKGIEQATRLLAFDPYDETVHRDLMAMLWRSGHRNRALQKYVSLRKFLDAELGVPPEPETADLFQRIRSAPASPKHNLPAETAVFVGREASLTELGSTLAQPHCRLINILGPGGVGKTRLLLKLGQRILKTYPGQFVNGVRFFSLAQLSSGQFLATSLAETLGISLSSEEPMLDLQNYLREKELLLLLDNFEHLLEDNVGGRQALQLVEQLIDAAPQVKFVVSSRERLRLETERVFSLAGLSTPTNGLTPTTDAFEAVELFVQNARRIDRFFVATPEQVNVIGRICRLLDGLPLGIELAAAWIRTLTPAEILKQLQAEFDFLQLSVHNRPERHQTLRNLFDHTWQMLDERETAVMQQLSIFRGPFTIQAAKAIATADRDTLLGLVDKSLLQTVQRDEVQHFAMHELLRRYAAEQLALDPDTEAAIKTAHGHYFAQFVQERLDPIRRGGPKQIFDEVAACINEIRAAWRWSQQSGDEVIIEQSFEGLFYFFWTKGWLQEGATTTIQVQESLRKAGSENSKLLTRIEMWEAEFYAWLGRYDESATIAQRIIETARRDKSYAELNFTLNILARLKFWQGDYKEAEALFEENMAVAHHLEDGEMIALVLNGLANTVAEGSKDYTKAHTFYRESLAIAIEYDDKFAHARALINLGALFFELEKLDEAKPFCQDSLRLYREIGYPHGIGAALRYLSQIAFLQKDYQQAKELVDESYALNQEAGDRRAVFESLCLLGNIARNERNFRVACSRYAEALQVAVDMDLEKLGLVLFLDLAELLQMIGQDAEALKFINFILVNPRSGQELIDTTRQFLENGRFDTANSSTSSDSESETSYEEMMALASHIVAELKRSRGRDLAYSAPS